MPSPYQKGRVQSPELERMKKEWRERQTLVENLEPEPVPPETAPEKPAQPELNT